MESDDSVVVTAPSVEEAVILGLTRLTATRDEVDIEVLDEGSKGFLGIGSREAKVRLTRRPRTQATVRREREPEPAPAEPAAEGEGPTSTAQSPPKDAAGDQTSLQPSKPSAVAPAEEPASATQEQRPAAATQEQAPVAASEKQHTKAEAKGPTSTAQSPPKGAAGDQASLQHSTPAVVAPVEEAPSAERIATVKEPEPAEKAGLDRARLEQIAREIAEHLLPNIDVDVSIEWVDEDRPTMWIALNGKDADSLVGPRARNLHSVQYLFRSLIYHKLDGDYNVVVDADGYRKRRRRSIESLAEEKADRAVELGRTVRLRPMPAHERRIVHITLRKDDRVETESVGRGRDRAVTVIPLQSNGGSSGRRSQKS